MGECLAALVRGKVEHLLQARAVIGFEIGDIEPVVIAVVSQACIGPNYLCVCYANEPGFRQHAVLQGCATPQAIPMSPDDRAALKPEPVIHVVHGASPALQITTPASVAGGGLITAATGSTGLPSGAELDRSYSLQDAAGELGEKLVQKLRNEGSMRNLHVEPALPQLPTDLHAASYRGKYPSGLVLEVTVPNQ